MYEFYEKLQTSAELSYVLHWRSRQDFDPKHEPARIYSAMASGPVVTPELYSGEGPFAEWLDHFDSVAKYAMRRRAALATIYEHEIASATRSLASCRAASRLFLILFLMSNKIIIMTYLRKIQTKERK